MRWKHYQAVDHPKWEPQVGRRVFGIRLLIPHFKFQFSKSIIKSSTFPIFLNLTYPLRKNISFPKCPKITPKFTQNRQTVVMVTSIEIYRCLKRERDSIGGKAVLSDVPGKESTNVTGFERALSRSSSLPTCAIIIIY